MPIFGYQFLPRTPEIIAERRIHLDRYANLAQGSQLTVHLIILLYTLVTSSAHQKHAGRSQKGTFARVSRSLSASLSVRLAEYGTYGQWIFGLGWATWLGFLCIRETAPDYLHLTKRFGLIAASQLPIHYLLAMPHPYSPLQLLRKGSYRANMSLHQVTGRIILSFFAAHVVLYSYAFVQMSIFWQSVRNPKITVGLISAGILFVLGVTSTGLFRRRQYRWFYRVHVTGSSIILVLLFFHVEHIRIYLLESAVVVITNAALKFFSSR
ncbi:hypothetical protein K491DRAFT_699250 [Lophiostoma macrostomum CBS 122681]|uniref:Ferric oxidoreductase domain-containing protein n=1 Tax=Lophiostoma macrostomum CBS 122681 TaxID=1314788 RepID=A0A6A6SN33_9PLEO|nr:hypothetical protein K491DRAFT_699250 [Lophiostoma macrostomum CBS 122681]